MAEITAAMVSELRRQTGEAMMDCKKALVEANGDMAAAIDLMRKRGQAKAVKKADRTAAEGLITVVASKDGKAAAIVEVNCETDFVARDENFKQFVELVGQQVLATKATDVTQLMATKVADGSTLEQACQGLIAKIGENIRVRRANYVESANHVAIYSHNGRIGVVVDLSQEDSELGKDLAMQIAATRPLVVTPEQVSPDYIAKEKEIFMAQALESGKPQAVVEKMIEGRIRKLLEEVSLVGQPFVKNGEITVGQLLQQKNAKVNRFVRYEVGEGIEKKVDNFVEEVMAQVRGN